MTYFNEDTMVQQTTADYLRDKLGWESVYAYNQAAYGHDGLLGRDPDREVVLTRYVRQSFKKFNPDLPETANDLIFQTHTFPPTPHAPRSLRHALCAA